MIDPLTDPHEEDRDRTRVGVLGGRERDPDLVPLVRCRFGRRPVALERLVSDVVERTAVLLRAGQERFPGLGGVGDGAVGGWLTAEADAGPQQIDGRLLAQVLSGPLPSPEHRLALADANALGDQRPLALETGGLIALVGVGEDVDHRLGLGHVAGAAHLRLEGTGRGGLVVLGVDLVVGRVDGAVVGEGRPGADRSLRAVGFDAVDAQDADQRVDRVPIAERVLVDAALADLLDDPVVGEMRLEASVFGHARAAASCPRPRSPGRGRGLRA